ncbi:MAG: YfhO family protein [Eubacterium sp.]|nr:YfhO family protein [Eubacterium sp.]
MKRNKKQKALCFLLLFSVAFVVIFGCTYFVFWKNGKSFIWDYDGIKQHYAALCYLGRYYREIFSGILRGDFVPPMFDLSLGMGEDIMTTLNFYGLGDPLTLLAALVPEEKTEYLYDFLVVLRIYLAGLSFSWCCRKKGRSWSATMIGALVYAFSGYILHVAVKHPFFVIPMIFLPLAVVGVDRALENKKLTLLILVTFFTALNGFYFFYMNTVFLGIYALIRMICQKKLFVQCWRCVAAYVMGTAMAGVLFVPSIAAYLSSTRSESAFDPGNLLLFDASRYNAILTRIIGPPRITWDYLGMASLVLPAVLMFFAGARKKNLELKANILCWTILMLVPFGGYLLNGFSYVSGRFMYLTTFVFALGMVYGLPELLKLTRKKLLVCFGGAGIYLVLVFFSADIDQLTGWFGFAMLAVTLLVLLFWNWCHAEKSFCGKQLPPCLAGWLKKNIYVLLTLTVALNIIGSGWLLFSNKGQGYAESFIDRGRAYQYVAASPEAEVENAAAKEASQTGTVKGIYRTDSPAKRTENTGMITGKNGVSSYFSMSNPNRIEYLLQMQDGGVLDSMFKIQGLDDRTWLAALASVGYYAVEQGKEFQLPYGYKLVREFKRGKKSYGLYENQYFLPLGITYDSYMTEEQLGKETQEDGVKMQELMLKTAILKEADLADEASGFQGRIEKVNKRSSAPELNSREIPYEIQSTKQVEIRGGKAVVKKNGGSLTLRLKESLPEAELYLRLPEYQMAQKNRTYCDITAVMGKQKKTIRALTNQWNWYFGREEYLFHLGITEGEGGETICKIRFQFKGSFELGKLKVIAQGMEDYGETIQARREHSLEHVVTDKNSISGEVTVPADQLLLLSIPYSGGWKAVVNGKETPLCRANTAYMALPLKAGENAVKLYYETPYLRLGLGISLAGFLACVGYWITCSVLPKRAAGKKEKSGGISI